MQDAILVLNAGSSSVKFSLFARTDGDPAMVAHGQVEAVHTVPHFTATGPTGHPLAEYKWPAGVKIGHDGAVVHIVDWLKETFAHTYQLAAVGHRVVHGGAEFAAPVRLDGPLLEKLDQLSALAPLHQPHNLAPIRSLMDRVPGLPQVACFDTAFHRSNPKVAQMYALPQALTEAGVRRYGFHGLSYEYIAQALPAVDAQAARGRTVVLHLGNGASMCALHGGVSVASTMGFTAVDGLPMGTRCGAIDPGVLLYLMQDRRLNALDLETLIWRESGLLGVSGVSSDMRVLLESDAPAAREAVDLFVYRVGLELGALASALGGLDALVFTAGIGEHAPAIRARVCKAASWLGVDLDEAANASKAARITTAASRVQAWVVPTNEELMIARHTIALLGGDQA
jgi:acetate kinase